MLPSLVLFIGYEHPGEICLNIPVLHVEFHKAATTSEDMSWCCLPRRAKKQENAYSNSIGGIYSEKNIRLFSYAELRSATDNFNRTNKVGRGGFGTVYKGTIRNGREVAVKVLSAESRQGIREFLTEIDVISNVKHPNLVELIGCCVEANNRILVYEYLQNSSLDRALLGYNSEPADFTWSIRSAICIGVARGLAYLHEEIASPIVHRDIKASNILLDKNYIPKIGDFGLAKLFPDNVTHISTRVAGTTGYLAPEYAWHGQLTKKADIYSFGVLVLEIVSGTSSSRSILADDKILLEKAWELYEAKKLNELIDPALGDYPEEEVVRYIKVALFCIQAAAARRPSMPQVVTMLSKPIRINERELTAPGYIHEYRSTASKANTSSHSRSKNSASEDSNMFSTVVPPTVTEMSPR
ncbi:putative LRR receptor-like serine/threonine-protein kinase [Dichanthelium oligosanthes]|uniref:Putative LRR receptor-like serine/threonine-protein kinase n=1 Tax=Dichanthelium oligosanthes TaxID=888268 RepID=A0A1E5VN17_9POAL|nr:putative LRR receptor-like serine/threonine-protein kinase [Dichanthelium oligosanthes]